MDDCCPDCPERVLVGQDGSTHVFASCRREVTEVVVIRESIVEAPDGR
jgi:hypothetical protein